MEKHEQGVGGRGCLSCLPWARLSPRQSLLPGCRDSANLHVRVYSVSSCQPYPRGEPAQAQPSPKARPALQVFAQWSLAYGPRRNPSGQREGGPSPQESPSGGFALVSGPVAKAEGPIGPLAPLLFLLPAASVSLSLRLLDTKQLSRKTSHHLLPPPP